MGGRIDWHRLKAGYGVVGGGLAGSMFWCFWYFNLFLFLGLGLGFWFGGVYFFSTWVEGKELELRRV